MKGRRMYVGDGKQFVQLLQTAHREQRMLHSSPGSHWGALGDRWSKAGNQEAKSRMQTKRKECWPDPPGRIWRRLSESSQQEEQGPDSGGIFGRRKSKQEARSQTAGRKSVAEA
ncbi:hypothetical protein GOODEAATRI_001577 [Goodea atripinnis]|uniref:Uncharacterized protein n=1 Tax=Goodea atripinnis TaxID=208336 RepID=A0ABV0MXV2_9TELE